MTFHQHISPNKLLGLSCFAISMIHEAMADSRLAIDVIDLTVDDSSHIFQRKAAPHMNNAQPTASAILVDLTIDSDNARSDIHKRPATTHGNSARPSKKRARGRTTLSEHTEPCEREVYMSSSLHDRQARKALVSLPHEILETIFNYLPTEPYSDLVNLCKTHRQFQPEAERRLYSVVSFHENIASDGTSIAPILNFLRTVTDRPELGHHVRALRLPTYSAICGGLPDLRLSLAEDLPLQERLLYRGGKNLTEQDWEPQNVLSNMLRRILSYLPGLEELISGEPWSIPSTSPPLHKLHILHWSEGGDLMQENPAAGLASILNNAPQLESLVIDDWRSSIYGNLQTSLDHLTQLYIDDTLGPGQPLALLDNCRHLEDFQYLMYLYERPTMVLDALKHNYASLRCLALSGGSRVAVINSLERFTSLEYVWLGWGLYDIQNLKLPPRVRHLEVEALAEPDVIDKFNHRIKAASPHSSRTVELTIRYIQSGWGSTHIYELGDSPSYEPLYSSWARSSFYDDEELHITQVHQVQF